MSADKQNWRTRAAKRLRKPKPSIVSNLPPTELQDLFGVSSKPPKKRRIHALGRSFACALHGFFRAVKTERNLRIHLTAVWFVSWSAWLANLPRTSCALLVLCFAMVMTAELLNTAMEYLCDKTADGFNQFIRDAKDTAAAAVLVCAVGAAVVGVLLFTQNDAYLSVWRAVTAHWWGMPCAVAQGVLATAWVMRT